MKRKLGISVLFVGLMTSGVFGYEWYTAPPVIHAKAYEVEHGRVFDLNEDLKVSEDVVSKTIIKGEIDSNQLGEQSITVQVENERAITATAEIEVVVVDHSAPAIQAEDEYKVEAKTDFDLKKMIKAVDNVDGDITAKMEISPYDTSSPKEQQITLISTDSSHNQSTKNIHLIVEDTTKPVLTVKNQSIEVGKKINLLDGVTAKDNIDGDLSGQIKTEGKLDTNKTGQYEIVYKVKDKSGNEAAAKSRITVKAKPKPVAEPASAAEASSSSSKAKSTNEAAISRSEKKTASYSPMSLYFNGKRVSYANGGKSSGQSIIDNYNKASTWGGAAVFSGTDGLNTHFIGHNPGVFAGIWNANSFIITDKNGAAYTYHVTKVYRVNDQAIGVNNGVNYWNRITGVGGGERVTFQACQNDDINYIVEAVMSR